jgi:radical SAM-linked protein
MRYTGHLDLHKAWERSLRRANLRLAYSQGFHPQPKINLACALPLGFTSECELVDITLENEIPVDHILQKLVPALPPGILVTEIAAVDPQSPSLQTQVQSAEYQITLLVETPGFQEATATLFSLTEIPRIRRGKPYDLRPLLEDYSVLPDSEEGQTCVQVRLSARDGATGRPEEFISALGYEPYDARYHRTRLIVKETQPV